MLWASSCVGVALLLGVDALMDILLRDGQVASRTGRADGGSASHVECMRCSERVSVRADSTRQLLGPVASPAEREADRAFGVARNDEHRRAHRSAAVAELDLVAGREREPRCGVRTQGRGVGPRELRDRPWQLEEPGVVGEASVVDAGVDGVSSNGTPGTFTVQSAVGADIREALASAVVKGGFGLMELRPAHLSLEEIFLQLTTSDTSAAGVDE